MKKTKGNQTTKCLVALLAATVATAAAALDNTISNEFWCTWGRIETPAASASAVSATDVKSDVCVVRTVSLVGDVLDSFVGFAVQSMPFELPFSSQKPGLTIIVR